MFGKCAGYFQLPTRLRVHQASASGPMGGDRFQSAVYFRLPEGYGTSSFANMP